jgi:8-oxo-dGTP diphosphatase
MPVVPFQRTPSEEFELAQATASLEDAIASGSPSREAAALVRFATALQYAGRHDEAIDQFEAVLARSGEPGFDEYEHFAWQHLGKCLVEAGRVEDGIAAFHRALALRVPMRDVGLVASSRRALDAGSTPGGHLEFGESPEACAARETLEETGVIVGACRFLTMTNDVLEADGRHYVTIWIACEHVSGEGEPLAPHELDTVEWFAPDALPTPLFAPFEAMLASGALER